MAPSHRKRSRHGRKKARALAIFVAVWVAAVALLVVTMKRKGSEAPTPAPGYVEKDVAPAEDDIQLMSSNLQQCSVHLQDFLKAPDAAARSSHVLKSVKTVGRMAKFYAINPPTLYPDALKTDFRQVIHTPAGPAIETGWILSNEQKVEAVFFEEGGDWKMDWDAHVRFNTEPWALFLSAQGPVEGVFRVLARERIGASGRSDEYIALVLGVPRAGFPGEMTSSTPEIRVKRISEAGRKIEEAFKMREKGVGAFESIAVKNDPADMIRLRVRMVREGGEERVFKITELLNTHWLEIDEPVIKVE